MTPTQAERVADALTNWSTVGFCDGTERIIFVEALTSSPAPADSEAVRLLREWRRWIENSNFIDAPSPISETRAYLASVDGQKEPG